ncbi:hypothetical protein DV738_g3533, partial [Chaetothyriales sp. CBS 135597]
MRLNAVGLAGIAATLLEGTSAAALPEPQWENWSGNQKHTPIEAPSPKVDYAVSLGPRPYYIIQNMTDGPLKSKLQSCENGPFSVTGWSVGHRGGGTLLVPEETSESLHAGARMGSGVLECDVAFTADRGLVCRHDLCDLHRTTDILVRSDLAGKCTTPFTPANDTASATAVCCTSDITLAEFESLRSRMDGANTSAVTPEDYISGGIPDWRTELYNTWGQVLTLETYIDLVDSLPGYRNFTPELKTPPDAVPMPFNGYTQEQYARDMIETFIRKGIDPNRVFAQSFNPPDIFQWIAEYPEFGKHAVYLDEDGDTAEDFAAAVARLPELKAQGVNIIAPPFNYLLTTTDDNSTIIPSSYATAANEAGLAIIAWSFERSGPLANVLANDDYYYNTFAGAVHSDGQFFEVLDVLAQQANVSALFTDWSATVTYYANCFGLTGVYGEQFSL